MLVSFKRIQLPKFSASWCTWLFLIATISVGFYLYVIDPSRRVLMDLSVYSEAAHRYREGLSIYDHLYRVQERDGRFFELYFFYPPLLPFLLSKINLSEQALKFSWCLLSYLAILGSAYFLALLGQHAPVAREKTFIFKFSVASFFLICFEPLYWSQSIGQVNALILFLITLACWSGANQSSSMAGVAIALATALKASPAVLMFMQIVERRWRIVLTGILFLFITSGIIALTTPSSVFGGTLFSLSPLLAGSLERHYMFNYVADRALLEAVGLDHLIFLRGIVRAVIILTGLLAVYLVRGNDTISHIKRFSLSVILMILASPTIWYHHLSWSVIPLACLLCRPVESSNDRYKILAQCCAFYFVIFHLHLISVWLYREQPELLWIGRLGPTLTLIILGGFILKKIEPNESKKPLSN